MAEGIELKPCPFCGREVEHYSIRYTGPWADVAEIRCDNCGADFHIETAEYVYGNRARARMPKDAIGIWNSRAEDKSEEEPFAAGLYM